METARLTLAHVQAWNTWWDDYHNTPEGLARLIADIGIPDTVTRSACMLVALDGAGERDNQGVRPVEPSRVAAHIAELGVAGADEVIVVADPITEQSVRELGALL